MQQQARNTQSGYERIFGDLMDPAEGISTEKAEREVDRSAKGSRRSDVGADVSLDIDVDLGSDASFDRDII